MAAGCTPLIPQHPPSPQSLPRPGPACKPFPDTTLCPGCLLHHSCQELTACLFLADPHFCQPSTGSLSLSLESKGHSCWPEGSQSSTKGKEAAVEAVWLPEQSVPQTSAQLSGSQCLCCQHYQLWGWCAVLPWDLMMASVSSVRMWSISHFKFIFLFKKSDGWHNPLFLSVFLSDLHSGF